MKHKTLRQMYKMKEFYLYSSIINGILTTIIAKNDDMATRMVVNFVRNPHAHCRYMNAVNERHLREGIDTAKHNMNN